MLKSEVYNPEAFAARVEYAIYCLIHNQMDSREHDTCYEMNDGDAVVTAILRQAATNSELRASFARYWRYTRNGLPVAWIETAVKYAHIPTDRLPELARRMRQQEAEGINSSPAADASPAADELPSFASERSQGPRL
jgi:hypothetical protein